MPGLPAMVPLVRELETDMLRTLLTALVLTGVLSTAAAAFEIDQMTDQERAIFRSEIRDYLLENPEVLMEAISVLEERRAAEAAAQEDLLLSENHDEIYNDGFSYVGGNPDGDLVVVEFLDYRCGYCKRAFPSVEELLATDGNIRFIVKEFPILGEESVLASRYAIATKMVAGDEAYKKAHDTLMTWGGPVNEAALARISRTLKADHVDILAKMYEDDVTETIERNRALGAKLQIQGTPSFIMGDVFVRGYLELDQMRNMVRLVREEQS